MLISALDPSSGLANDELNQAEPNPRLTNAPNYVVFWHPAYSQGQTSVVAVEAPELIKHLQRLSQDPGTNAFVRINNYTDPVGFKHPLYEGAWVAGLARVPDTPLIEVYQARDRVYTVRVIALALVGVGVSASLISSVRRRILGQAETRSNAASDRSISL